MVANGDLLIHHLIHIFLPPLASNQYKTNTELEAFSYIFLLCSSLHSSWGVSPIFPFPFMFLCILLSIKTWALLTFTFFCSCPHVSFSNGPCKVKREGVSCQNVLHFLIISALKRKYLIPTNIKYSWLNLMSPGLSKQGLTSNVNKRKGS